MDYHIHHLLAARKTCPKLNPPVQYLCETVYVAFSIISHRSWYTYYMVLSGAIV